MKARGEIRAETFAWARHFMTHQLLFISFERPENKGKGDVCRFIHSGFPQTRKTERLNSKTGLP